MADKGAYKANKGGHFPGKNITKTLGNVTELIAVSLSNFSNLGMPRNLLKDGENNIINYFLNDSFDIKANTVSRTIEVSNVHKG